MNQQRHQIRKVKICMHCCFGYVALLDLNIDLLQTSPQRLAWILQENLDNKFWED